MESIFLQILLIFGVVVFFAVIVIFLKRKSLSIKYTLLWLFSAFVMLAISIFPGVFQRISEILGFTLLSNAVFSLLLGFIILISLSLTSIVSKQTEKIKHLVQINAIMEKRIRDLEKILNREV